jgi:hypothetical protein
MAGQSMTLPLIERHNDPVSIFARVDSKKDKGTAMATKTKKQTTTTTVETPTEQNGHHPEQTAKQAPPAKQTFKQATAPVKVTRQEQRAALLAAGLKKCPGHAKFWDRLPDEVKQPIAGQTDPSIRPLAEYSKNTSYCKACDHLAMKDARERAKQSGTANPAKQEARNKRLATLLARYNDLAQKIDALQAEKRADAEKQEQQQEQQH